MNRMIINCQEPDARASHGFCDQEFLGRPPIEAMTRITLARAGVLMVRLIGPPGSGKTELIRATLRRCAYPQRVAAITVNPASARDADRLRPHCGFIDHIDAAVPNALEVWGSVSALDVSLVDLVLVEGSSGMVPLTDIGQDVTVAVLAYSGGDDKAAEYHTLIEGASLVILNKSDIRAPFGFNSVAFQGDVHAANPDAELMEISAATGEGLDRWFAWLERLRLAKRHPLTYEEEQASEWFFG